jgi:hypothetical protein
MLYCYRTLLEGSDNFGYVIGLGTGLPAGYGTVCRWTGSAKIIIITTIRVMGPSAAGRRVWMGYKN